MREHDEALSLPNPRIISAVYFGLLAVMFTLALDTVLYAFGINQLLPLYQATLLADVTTACFAALFAKRMVYCQGAYLKKSFFWAVLMTFIAIPIYDAGFVGLIALNSPAMFDHSSFSTILQFYLVIVLYSFILCGWWLALVTGVAAMYLRGCLIYYILRSLS